MQGYHMFKRVVCFDIMKTIRPGQLMFNIIIISKLRTTLFSAMFTSFLLMGIGSIASASTEVSVEIDGVKQTYPQSAVIIDGNTLVPLRSIFESLGAEVEWIDESQTVIAKKGAQLIKLTVNQQTAYLNDQPITLAAKAQLINGSTMVPLRFVAESLGADVKYYSDQNKVSITSSKNESEVEQKVNEIYASIIQPSMTDFQKIYAINNYIDNHVSYDFDNYRNKTIPYISYTAEGALIKGVAVCQGYAETMKLLLDKAGIENKMVFGEANGVRGWDGHAWNLVKLDGNYYHIDSTWNDRDLIRRQSNDLTPAPLGDLRLDYFLVSDDRMLKDHRFNPKMYPKSGKSFENLFTGNTTIPVGETKDRLIFMRANRDTTWTLFILDAKGFNIGGSLSQEKVSGVLNETVVGGYLYYLLEQPTTGEYIVDLYRVTLEGTEKTLIAKDMYGFSTQIIGDSVYYYTISYDPKNMLSSQASIHRVLLKNGEDSVLVNNASILDIADKHIYYTKDGDIHRISLNGDLDTIVAKNIDGLSQFSLFTDRYLFYIEKDLQKTSIESTEDYQNRKNRIHRVRLDGSEDTVILTDTAINSIQEYRDGKIIYETKGGMKTVKVDP